MGSLPVNICINNTPISYSEIWSNALALRLLMDQCLVIGKSMIITPSVSNNASVPPAILDMAFQNKISMLINRGNRVSLQRELYEQFNKWDHSDYPQRWMEKVLHQLIKLFQRWSSSNKEDEIFQMEYEIKEKLAISSNFSSLYEYIKDIFISLLSSSDEKKDMKEFIENVKCYITNNYACDICIEDIARKFNINSTYMTKLFKKYFYETPVKYIIKLRISESKHLLENSPELDIKEISEIVGYIDQHYFSRVFKEITNVSPSVYRDTICKKETS